MEALYQLSYSPEGGFNLEHERTRRQTAGAAQPTTKLMSLSGTAMTLRTVAPASSSATVASARAAASSPAASSPEATWRRAFTLPLIWKGTSMSSSTSRTGSASGMGSQASDPSWPVRDHHVSAAWVAGGRRASTSGPQPPRRPRGMGRQRGEEQHQRLGDLPGHAAVCEVVGQVVVQLGDARDGDVEAQRLHPLPHSGDRLVQHPSRLLVGRGIGHADLAGVFVEHRAPDALEQAEHTDDRLGLPRPALL